MFNGLSKHVSGWLAGFILACLIAATLGPFGMALQPESTQVQGRAVALRRSLVSHQADRKRPEQAGPIAQSTKSQTAAKPSPATEVNGIPVDVYLLARIIHAEARGEPFEGQVAIGAVLLNRLKDPRFPKSLPQIIFKPGEFCTVRDGQVWLNPNDESIRAAKLALAGWDPSGGALYFYNPAKTTSSWIWSRPITNRIGHHTFAA